MPYQVSYWKLLTCSVFKGCLTLFYSLGIICAYQKHKRYVSKQISHSVFENKFTELGKVGKILLELFVLDLEFPLSCFSKVSLFYFTVAAAVLGVPLVTRGSSIFIAGLSRTF